MGKKKGNKRYVMKIKERNGEKEKELQELTMLLIKLVDINLMIGNVFVSFT